MFISFEGAEGAGKSTLIAALAAHWRGLGKSVLTTREPGAGEFGSAVRSLLLKEGSLSGRAELFLFLADRAEHVVSIIRPAIEQGDIVLCDRFADSTVVYQGYGRGFDMEWLRNLNQFATNGLIPDLTILLDIDPEVGIQRQRVADRIGGEELDFHRKVREGFLTEAERDSDRWRIIDAGQAQELVLDQVIKLLDSYIES